MWQLALHCHLRLPVPLVVLGFNQSRGRLEETGRQAAYCKHTAPGSPNRLTRADQIVMPASASIDHPPRVQYSTEAGSTDTYCTNKLHNKKLIRR